MATAGGRRLGGWKRARQWAERRRQYPSPLEAKVRQGIADRGWRAWFEVEVRHPDPEAGRRGGMPQFLDVLTLVPGAGLVALEIDGSQGWHFSDASPLGSNHTMGWYDEQKAKLMRRRGVPLYYIPKKVARDPVCLADELAMLALAGARQGELL